MEQTLGHVTHCQNLRAVAGRRRDLEPVWLPILFDPGSARLVPFLGSNWTARASLRSRRALSALQGPARPESILFHTQATALLSLGIMARVPSVVSIDATPMNFDTVGEHYGHRSAGEGFLDRQKFRRTRDAFRAASMLVAWSDWARDSLVVDYGVDPARVRVLAPGASERFFELGRSRVARNERGGGPVRLLFVGGDFDRKGGALLLEAMRGGLGARCELHIVTRHEVPPQRGVVLHRNVSPNSAELLELFAMADVFVLPSLGECLAVALMEATAAGLPVVTSDVGALRESVIDGVSGLICHAGDPVSLQRALESIVADEAMRSRMGRAGFELASDKFDASANDDRLLDLLVELGASARRSEVA
jgi:glycosyltransferase involved in cell wall biosynthesis